MSTSATRPYLLLVEDSPTTLMVISKNLEEHFDLITAADGEAAWELLLKDDKIELVISDMNMPKLGGLELLDRIRQSDNPRIAALPVFIMTTGEDDREKEEALSRGANDFLSKPINPLVLRARVNVHHRLAQTTRKLDEVQQGHQGKLLDYAIFRDVAGRAIARAHENNTNMSLVLVSIDQLAGVSSEENIEAVLLDRVSHCLPRSLREEQDIAAYAGQGEFVVLLPGTRRMGAAVVADRIRERVENMKSTIHDMPLTISASVNCALADDARDYDALLNTGRRRIDIAREQGGNLVVVKNEAKRNFAF